MKTNFPLIHFLILAISFVLLSSSLQTTSFIFPAISLPQFSYFFLLLEYIFLPSCFFLLSPQQFSVAVDDSPLPRVDFSFDDDSPLKRVTHRRSTHETHDYCSSTPDNHFTFIDCIIILLSCFAYLTICFSNKNNLFKPCYSDTHNYHTCSICCSSSQCSQQSN